MAVNSSTFNSPTVNNALGSSGLTGSAGNESLMGPDAFMKLLVAQLKNQDPQQPQDTKEMVTQLSQLTSVQELQNVRSQIENLTIATAGLSNIQSSSIVGKMVTASGNSTRLGEVGNVNFGFEITGQMKAKTVNVKIMDSSGEVIRSMTVDGAFPGTHQIEWDGKRDNGNRAPAGLYRIEVSATDENGQPVASSTDVRGLVSEISYSNGYPELVIGNRRVMMGDIQTIGN